MNKRQTYKSTEERERRLRYMREWHRKNKEYANKKAKEYQKLHPEIHRAASRRYAIKHRKNKNPYSTETWKGRRSEILALSFFKNAKDMNDQIMNNPGFDIEWNGLKIDVKSSNGFKNKKHKQWTFLPSTSGVESCDYYFCMLFNDNVLDRIFFIPSNEFGKKGITIGRVSKKWERFLLNKNLFKPLQS